MLSQIQLKQHFLTLSNALYVWGANGKEITKEYMDELYKVYGTSTYNKAYYDAKLKAGKGKLGADCSGALFPVSGYDTTAQGYYDRCVKRGSILGIPRNKVCLVFKVNGSGRINHVGCYTGDGYVSEMASSQLNYQRKALDNNGWDYWGFPDFVDYTEEKVEKLEVDGEWGVDTTKLSQKALGTTVDGIISNQPVSCAKYLLNALESSWEFEKTGFRQGSAFIKALQELVGLTGRDVDGHCGYDTIVALQKFLAKLGFYKGEVDGFMGKLTVCAWQMYVNSIL